jgi:hypothetical protein
MESDVHGKVKCKQLSSKKKVDDSVFKEYRLNSHVTNTLALYCLTHLTPSILHCHTEYKSVDGQIYCAHPNYHQKPWFDYALVKWSGFNDLFPSCIHTFLNFQNVQSGSCFSFPHSGQRVAVKAPGFYAVIESYDEIVDDDNDSCADDDGIAIGEFDDNDDGEEVNRSIFRESKLSLIPCTLRPIL